MRTKTFLQECSDICDNIGHKFQFVIPPQTDESGPIPMVLAYCNTCGTERMLPIKPDKFIQLMLELHVENKDA